LLFDNPCELSQNFLRNFFLDTWFILGFLAATVFKERLSLVTKKKQQGVWGLAILVISRAKFCLKTYLTFYFLPAVNESIHKPGKPFINAYLTVVVFSFFVVNTKVH